ncbi:MAG: helix-turn-helix domain-containing protein [Gammaproteobacteria bacterium]
MHLRVAFLQFVQVSLKALKYKETEFEPQTLGEHIKKRRLTLKVYQREVAERFGVDPNTILNWEKGLTAEPPIKVIPAILAFLGYNPFPAPITLSERMLAARRLRGWTMKEAAQPLGVDPCTWQIWEYTGTIKWRRYQAQVEDLLTELRL